MKKRNKGLLIAVVIIALIGGAVYMATRKSNKGKAMVKTDYITALFNNPLAGITPSPESYNILLTFEEGYLKAWFDGLQQHQVIFNYNGGRYYTKGGTAI